MNILIPNFSGIAPRFADRLLDDTQASFVANLKPSSGDLRGFRSLKVEFRIGGLVTVRRSIKFFYPGEDRFVWFLDGDVNADAVRSPLATDAFNRVYYTDVGHFRPQVTTLDDIAANVPSIDLGVTRPTVAPGVTATGGVGAVNEIRAYVYTYVGKYGSVGPPSPPTIVTGRVDSTWTISITPSPEAVFVDIYRSSTGNQSSGNYFKVGRITLPTTTFIDTMADDLVPLQPPLDSFDNDPPLPGLQGLCLHSSGALTGFVDRTVCFSRPFLPHAWPESNRYVVGDEVVGIAPIGNSIVALTKTSPTILSGNLPETMGINAFTDPEPCQSKRSIVVMNNSVIFASTNGLVSISQNGISRPINALMTRDDFEVYSPSTILAASYGSYYIAFYENSRGFAVALPPYEPVSFVPLDRYASVTGLDTDSRTGDLFVTQSNLISIFDRVVDTRFATTFRSKEFITLKPVNFKAFQILFKVDMPDEDAALLIEAANIYNAARFAEGFLDVVGGYTVGGSIDTTFGSLDEILGGLPPIQPIGGEPLYDVDGGFSIKGVRFTMFADGLFAFSKVVTTEDVFVLPEGYKATRYYFEISSALTVQRLIVAETARECRLA